MHDFYRGQTHDDHTHLASWNGTLRKPMTVGIGGPVGSGKTAQVDRLCQA
jgi:Ni2+-binding GTPase involved in maturation of urease and hydrogenase